MSGGEKKIWGEERRLIQLWGGHEWRRNEDIGRGEEEKLKVIEGKKKKIWGGERRR